MNKIGKVLLALLLVLMMLMTAACSDDEGRTVGKKDRSEKSKKETVEKVTEDDEEETTEDEEETTEGEEETTEGDEEKPTEPDDVVDVGDISVEETVVFESDGVKVTLTGYQVDEYWGPEFTFKVENNSDVNVTVNTDAASINGYMISSSLYADVAAGKIANESLSVHESDLERAGISTIAELQFIVHMYNSDTYDDIATSDLITVNTSAAPYEQKVDDSGEVVFEGNGLKVVCKGFEEEEYMGSYLNFYIENNTGKTVRVTTENLSVDGVMADWSLFATLRDGTRSVEQMSLYNMEDMGISSVDEIKSIEFTIESYDLVEYNNIVETDPITINFN